MQIKFQETTVIDNYHRNLPKFNTDILSHEIFSRLAPVELFSCSTVCKDWDVVVKRIIEPAEVFFDMLIESKMNYIHMPEEQILRFIKWAKKDARKDKEDLFRVLESYFPKNAFVLGLISDAQKKYTLALNHYFKWLRAEDKYNNKKICSGLKHMIYLSNETNSMRKLLMNISDVRYQYLKDVDCPNVTHLLNQKDMSQIVFEEVLCDFYKKKLSDKKCYIICPSKDVYGEKEDKEIVDFAKKFTKDLENTGMQTYFPTWGMSRGDPKSFQIKILEADFVFIFNTNEIKTILDEESGRGVKQEIEFAKMRGEPESTYVIHAKEISEDKRIMDLTHNILDISVDYHKNIFELMSKITGVGSEALNCFEEKVNGILNGEIDHTKLNTWREKYQMWL